MLSTVNSDILENTSAYIDYYNSLQNVPFTEEKFLQKAMPKLAAEMNLKYPLQIRLPKSVPELLNGDLEPARVINIKEPLMGPYGPMWFGDSSKGVRLLSGYKNGDSRYICNYALGDEDVHGILAGSTGQGKSVTLNAFIYGMCYMYAPWEVELVLCDPKIVEFKKIATMTPMPHISAVAATGDADYLISVLAKKCDEMIKRNAIFNKAGQVTGHVIAKISDFRKVTGLALPQVLIVVDEFQTMFKDAGKRLGELLSIIDAFARLGRNTGFHLLMASQELGSDLPKSLLSNIKLRMAMGCFAQISEQILNNNGAAANMGKKGYMLLNNQTNLESAECKKKNVLFRVPFPPDEQIMTMSKSIIEAGKTFNFNRILSFYDETSLVYEDAYSDWLKQYNLDENKIYLGEPSFMMEDTEQCVKLNFTATDMESIGVISSEIKSLVRFFKMFRFNLESVGTASRLVLSVNTVITEQCKVREFASSGLFFKENQYEGNPFFDIFSSTVYKRQMILKAEELIFNGSRQRTKDTDEEFNRIFADAPHYDSELNRERFAQYLFLTATNVQLQIGLNIIDNHERRMVMIKSCVELCTMYGAQDSNLTINKVPILYVFIIGLNQIVGIGRNPKNKYVEFLRNSIRDAGVVKVRVITFTTTYEDMTDLVTGTRYFLFEKLNSKEQSKIKIEDNYPKIIGPQLAVLFDRIQTESCKFKKMMLDGEII